MNTSSTAALSAPFDPADVRFKLAAVSGNRALCIAYVNARCIMDRLDEVLTPAGWQDEYVNLPDGAVMCKLSCRLGDEWIVKCDVGGRSEQPDDGDRMKAAFSDALKRAAVKFGCGRYLYRLPSTWALPGIATNAAQPATKPAIAAAPPARPAPASPPPDAVLDLVDDDEPRDVQTPAPRITDNQERQLVELLRTTGANINRFLQHFGIRSVGSLSQADFPQAVQLLRRKAAAGIGQGP